MQFVISIVHNTNTNIHIVISPAPTYFLQNPIVSKIIVDYQA